MAITTFTTGQILTAAQMNAVQSNDFNQTVSTKTVSYTLVAADKGTRVVMNNASTTTITVNTSLFSAGDTVVLQNIGAGVCTVTAGTATVSSAGPLAIPQYGSGTLYFTSAGVSIYFPSAVTVAAPAAGGLTFISATAIGSTVASVTVSSAFDATYDNYRIIVNGGVSSITCGCRMTFGATATGYYFGSIGQTFAGASSGTQGQNSSSFNVGEFDPTSFHIVMDITAPNLANETLFTSQSLTAKTSGKSISAAGYLNDSTQYTAFTLTPAGATLTGGTIRVYGYANS